jgi:malonyl-CoA O-methyltransferase
MPAQLPPTLDPVAAARWQHSPPAASPWLHEEVARRMEERLQWIRFAPQTWVHWEPLRGGMAVHGALARRYPAAQCFVVEPDNRRSAAVARGLARPWWSLARWAAPPLHVEMPADASAGMVWSNMALHMAADPEALLARWHRVLAPDGFLMFSCLGPDTLRAVRDAWCAAGWPPPAHAFTDMHDWGDMLVNGGFAEPVMDMERITLSFQGPRRALEELRGLGRNLHVQRFAALHGRNWMERMLQVLAASAPTESSGVALEFEVIYGHAFKARPRLTIKQEIKVSVDEMRHALKHDRRVSGGAE